MADSNRFHGRCHVSENRELGRFNFYPHTPLPGGGCVEKANFLGAIIKRQNLDSENCTGQTTL